MIFKLRAKKTTMRYIVNVLKWAHRASLTIHVLRSFTQHGQVQQTFTRLSSQLNACVIGRLVFAAILEWSSAMRKYVWTLLRQIYDHSKG